MRELLLPQRAFPLCPYLLLCSLSTSSVVCLGCLLNDRTIKHLYLFSHAYDDDNDDDDEAGNLFRVVSSCTRCRPAGRYHQHLYSTPSRCLNVPSIFLTRSATGRDNYRAVIESRRRPGPDRTEVATVGRSEFGPSPVFVS